MEVATLVIAVVGLALAMLSLGWQAATFFLSGPRVKVYLREGLRGPVGVMLAPASIYTGEGRDALTRMGYTEHVLGVEAVNRGRLPATIGHWSLKFKNDVAYQNPTDPTNPSLPFRLEPETSATWYAPAEDLQEVQDAFTDQSERQATLHAEITLASGRTIRSKNALVIGATGTRTPRRRLSRALSRKQG
jgi:hypothetical protein